MKETIKDIPLGELHPFPDHPFGVRDDEAMEQTVESIREYGVLTPAIARPREDGGYRDPLYCRIRRFIVGQFFVLNFVLQKIVGSNAKQ